MVAASAGTAKAEEAFRRGGVHVVYPAWLNDSMCQWVRQSEELYRVPRSDRLASLDTGALQDLASSVHADPENADEVALDDLANMDWGEAEDEVEAFLDDDDDDDTNSELSQSQHSDASEAPSDAGDGADDLLRSPLSRRRHAAAQRGGPSKLRQSILADDADDGGSSDSDASAAPSPKRARTHDRVAALRDDRSPPESEDEGSLDELAHEMERELGDDL